MADAIAELTRAAAGLRDDAEELARRMEAEGVADCVYNPLMYAWEIHEEFIRVSGGGGAKTVLLGMNPGPHGMGQMGIPFAATSVVRDLLGISGIGVGKPTLTHPRRPVHGSSEGGSIWNKALGPSSGQIRGGKADLPARLHRQPLPIDDT